MIKIEKATPQKAELLSEIAHEAFLDSHGHSAAPADVRGYMERSFATTLLRQELKDPNVEYHIVHYNDKPAGFSKIGLNMANDGIFEKHITKLDRLYLLKEFYGQELGRKLMEFNIELCKTLEQKGMWLYVWVENARAIAFYSKMGFKVIGSYDFKISETKSNPNYIMYLSF